MKSEKERKDFLTSMIIKMTSKTSMKELKK